MIRRIAWLVLLLGTLALLNALVRAGPHDGIGGFVLGFLNGMISVFLGWLTARKVFNR